MLASLHAALAFDFTAWWARALMLAHFGFFLMWQPIWRADRDLNVAAAALVVAVGIGLGLVANWWLAALWLGALAGLIGGQAFGADSSRQRLATLLALVYLLGMLLGWVVPHLFPDPRAIQEIGPLMRYGWLAFPVILLFVHQTRAEHAPHPVDFIYSLTLFLLVMVLVLGSFALKLVTQGDYVMALAQTLIVAAGVLLVLAWLWAPRAGFAGFGPLLSRYLLSVGLPFEQWVRNLARIAESERDPDAFLKRASAEIARLPWVAGGTWHTLEGRGEFGSPTPHRVEIGVHRLRLELYTKRRMSPALLVHTRLLTELLEFFYEAKLREQLQRQNAYLQAVHETGARLTHDVKNLLQSLTTLCAAAEASDPAQSDALQALIRRQLPVITERLQQTLKKLKAPHAVDREERAAGAWWSALRARYEPQGVELTLNGDLEGAMLPAELFDSVADNLLQNALRKRTAETDVRVRVEFAPGPAGYLRVCDSGAAMPAETATRLFEAPVASHNGLGIGLYQAARQAERLGYRLRLLVNEPGRVCFELGPDPALLQTAAA